MYFRVHTALLIKQDIKPEWQILIIILQYIHLRKSEAYLGPC